MLRLEYGFKSSVKQDFFMEMWTERVADSRGLLLLHQNA